jgi:hypothetical protein
VRGGLQRPAWCGDREGALDREDRRTGCVKVLTAVDVDGELDGLAMRGARYGFPGWVAQETKRAGKAKRIYLERPQAVAKARKCAGYGR